MSAVRETKLPRTENQINTHTNEANTSLEDTAKKTNDTAVAICTFVGAGIGALFGSAAGPAGTVVGFAVGALVGTAIGTIFNEHVVIVIDEISESLKELSESLIAGVHKIKNMVLKSLIWGAFGTAGGAIAGSFIPVIGTGIGAVAGLCVGFVGAMVYQLAFGEIEALKFPWQVNKNDMQ